MRSIQGMTLALIVAAPILLSACGQRGPLILPSEESSSSRKAIYMLYRHPDESKDSAKQPESTDTSKTADASATK